MAGVFLLPAQQSLSLLRYPLSNFQRQDPILRHSLTALRNPLAPSFSQSHLLSQTSRFSESSSLLSLYRARGSKPLHHQRKQKFQLRLRPLCRLRRQLLPSLYSLSFPLYPFHHHSSKNLIGLAGLPTAVHFAGMSLTTTAPAPTML